jgi:hypothetical protein
MEPVVDTLAALVQYVWALCCMALVCGLPPVAIGGLYYWLGVRPQDSSIQKLAEQMALQRADPKRGRRFEGVHQGRAFSIGRGIRSYRGGGRPHYQPALSVHLYLEPREPIRGRVGHSGGPVSEQATFETVFRQESPIERLSPEARAAMLAFARQRGNLWLEAFRPETRPRLEHTLADITGTTVESLRAVLDDLAGVARAVESTML